MNRLTTENIADYLRARNAVSAGQILVKSLSGGVANSVFMIMDMGAGEPIGTDLRSEGQKKRGVPDNRMRQGNCFVIKQPLEMFATAAEWRVDIDRAWAEADALKALQPLLPPGAIPEVLWLDREQHVLAISAAPTGSLNFKTELLAGRINPHAAPAAAAILASLHTKTAQDGALRQRFSDTRLFMQQRIDPYLRHMLKTDAGLEPAINRVVGRLLDCRPCLIHGDFSPKNMLLMPPEEPARPPLMLLDFEVVFWGNPAFDSATFINHLLLKAFSRGKKWRPLMIAADGFWNRYLAGTPAAVHQPSVEFGGAILGSLMLARLDGKSPVEYLTDETLRRHVRTLGKSLISEPAVGMDAALDMAGEALGKAADDAD